MTWKLINADVMEGLAQLPDESVQTVVTSPPYWGLRDYGTATWEGGDAAHSHRVGGQVQDTKAAGAITAGVRPGVDASACLDCGAVRIDAQLGLEPTPEAYVERLVGVFREVRRVLRPDGTAWLNLGDSYAATHQTGNKANEGDRDGWTAERPAAQNFRRDVGSLKPKDLVGIPWRVAFALQADGWYLRSDVIWAKPNPMPESVTDRPTKAHEYVFLLTRSTRYFYDADAVREGSVIGAGAVRHVASAQKEANGSPRNDGDRFGVVNDGYRNLRSVWNIATEPYPEAHFATFPKALVVPCVKAGTSEKGCCAECGAAWVRQVDRGESDYERLRGDRTTEEIRAAQDHRGREGTSWERGGNHTLTENGTVPSLRPRTAETIGWGPSCGCQKDVPATLPSGSTPSTTTGPPAPSTNPEPVPCTVLDPFAGSGTVGVVALRYGRSFVGIELSADYAEMARERIRNDAPLWNHAAEVV